jgi:hypothetical protein
MKTLTQKTRIMIAVILMTAMALSIGMAGKGHEDADEKGAKSRKHKKETKANNIP